MNGFGEGLLQDGPVILPGLLAQQTSEAVGSCGANLAGLGSAWLQLKWVTSFPCGIG